MRTFDVVVIGSGPGGYVASIRCAQLGMSVAIIEKYPVLGGTCLNVGCIPSKTLLDSSEHYYNARNHFDLHGIELSHLRVNLEKMMARKAEVVKSNIDGINYLMKKNKITVIHGTASFIDSVNIQISGGEIIQGKKIIIATGSKPSALKEVEVDKKKIITSTEILNLKEIPKSLLIIGGGVIGLELGSVFARLGSQIQVIEYADAIIPQMDRSLGKELQRILTKLGFSFNLKHKVLSAKMKGKQVELTVEDSGGRQVSFIGDYCLMAVGRKPFTQGLNLNGVGVKTDANGRILVDNTLKTNIDSIYAIGDVVRGPMLAHKAEEEGMFVAEILHGEKPHINYNLIPGVVYTWPEVASVGYTEEELKKEGKIYKIGQFPFKANGRARASSDTDGFVKVLADSKSDEILGVHIIGARAADLISEAVVAMEYRAASEDIARISHPHPTFSEAIREACLSATGSRPIHI